MGEPRPARVVFRAAIALVFGPLVLWTSVGGGSRIAQVAALGALFIASATEIRLRLRLPAAYAACALAAATAWVALSSGRPPGGAWLAAAATALATWQWLRAAAYPAATSRRQIYQAGALGMGLVLALLLAEGLLRVLFGADFRLGKGTEEDRPPESWVLDDELGCRPVFDGRSYTEYGTRPNRYDVRQKAGRLRLLFVGDSVTRRGAIIRGIRQVYGNRAYEYWNAGVEGYNTEQELIFYQRYNRSIEPDHVVLTLHNNDFWATPILFRAEDGRVMRFLHGTQPAQVSPWLLHHSVLYRLWLYPWAPADGTVVPDGDVEAALAGFQRLLKADRVRFTVLLLPILRPYPDGWLPMERARRDRSLRILQALGIRTFDLLPPLQQALADGVRVSNDPAANDGWHPSREAGLVFGSYLHERGLLDDG